MLSSDSCYCRSCLQQTKFILPFTSRAIEQQPKRRNISHTRTHNLTNKHFFSLPYPVPSIILQVSNWFANARRRLKNTVQGDGISWSRRIQAYNECAEGNAELFSIPSSEEEDDDDCLRPGEILFL